MGIAYRPEIDGLRAIAVLAVVLYHAGIGGAGFVGVDVFFVISGYLITSLLLREWRDTQAIDLLAFYARRVRRIFPAATVVVLAVLGVSSLLLGPAQQAHTSLSAGAALVFGANVFFQFTSGGYFDGVAEQMPLLHLWSLSVEEQFYFLWPALLIAVLRYRPAWLLRVIAGLAVASFLLAEGLLTQDGDAAFYQMPARFWELAAGGLIAALPTRTLPRHAASAGVLLTLAACILPLGHFPGVGALPAVAGASLVIAAVHGGASNALLASRPMVGVGLISYSLYLWHWPLLALYRATTVGDGSQNVRLALCALAVVLAIASYRYIEQPFRRMRWPKGRTVAIGATLSAALALSACMVGLREQPKETSARDPHPAATAAEQDRSDDHCATTIFDLSVPRCPHADKVAVWGDSTASSWRPAFPADAGQFSMTKCPPMDWLPDKPLPGNYKCRQYVRDVAEYITRFDTIVLIALWQSYPDRAGLSKTLAKLAPVRRVVIVGPTPVMRAEVPRCMRLGKLDDCAISRAEFDAHAGPILAELRAMSKPYPNVEVIDLTPQLCTDTACPPMKDGAPLYWDSFHVTATTARRLQSYLVPQ